MVLTKERVHTDTECIEYLTDCTLATVGKLILSTKPPIGELKRQINIAQFGINFLEKTNKTSNIHGRVFEICSQHHNSVTKWASSLRKKYGKAPLNLP